MEYSRAFENIKRAYEAGVYNKMSLVLCVKVGDITKDEYKELTGEDYKG